MQTQPPVAVIGLGQTGGPLAWRLADAGYPLAVHDADQAVLDGFAAPRVRRLRSPQAAAADSTVLLLALPSTRVVREVVAAAAPPAGTVVIAVGAGEPAELRALAETLAGRRIGLVDAAIGGGGLPSRGGELTLLAGGSPDAVEVVRPVLEALASRLVVCGGTGSGSAMQALWSLVAATRLAAGIEAMQIAKRFGLDPGLMARVLSEVKTGRATAEALLAEQVLTGRFASGVPLAESVAELTVALGLASETRTDVPLSRLSGEIWRMAAAGLEPDADHTALARWYEHRSGTRLRS